MILFLTNTADGRRGGQETNQRIYNYIKEKFSDVQPDSLIEVTEKIKSPLKHMIFNLAMVRKYKPDLLVVDISAGCRLILAVLWTKIFRIKLMSIYLGQRMTFRYNNRLVEKIIRYCEKFSLSNSDIVYTNSNYSAGFIKSYYSNRSEMVVVNDGITVNVSTSCSFENINEKEQINLLFVGACSRVKGLKYLIESIEYLDNSNFVLNIAGEFESKDAYYDEIMSLVSKNKYAGKINFLGFVEYEKLMKLYETASIFILSSLSEGYGKVLAEALSFGLPVVATNAGAIPEMVEDGVNALLVEPANSEELGVAIQKLISDYELRKTMRTANLSKAKCLQTWDSYYVDLEKKLIPAIIEKTGLRQINTSTETKIK